ILVVVSNCHRGSARGGQRPRPSMDDRDGPPLGGDDHRPRAARAAAGGLVMTRAIEADCVVVGGGSGGCVMAARLSEDAAAQVVLLEAGRDWRSNEAPPELRSMNGWR